MSDWLPDLLLLSDFDGAWDTYIAAVHEAFRKDFIHQNPPPFRGKRMGLKRHPIVDGMEATFSHFISEGKKESERTPDLRRCERIKWPRPIIEAVDTGQVRCWPTRRGRNRRIVLAVEDYSYIVVLADRGDYLLPWTAYCVEQEHRRKKFRKEYEKWKNGKS